MDIDLSDFFSIHMNEKFQCKCYCGLLVLDTHFPQHLFSCKTYMKNSRFYQDYLHEYHDSQKPYECLGKIKKNAENLKKIIEYQLEVIETIEPNKKLNELIDLKTFPQSFFEYTEEDIQKIRREELIFLRGELAFLIENVNQEFEVSLDLKKINSGDSTLNLPQLNLSKSLSEITSDFQQKQKPKSKLMLLRKCDNCKKSNLNFPQIYRLHECQHSLCSICLANLQKNYIYQFGNVSCLICNIKLTNIDLKNIIGVRELKKLDEFKNRKKTYPLINCLKCKQKFHKDPHDTSICDSNRETWLKCPYCNSDQCISCRCFPYHDNKSCEDYINNREKKTCRYCKQLFPADLTKSEELALQDICPFDECLEKSKIACTKLGVCEHPCAGVRNEIECLGCMKEDCQKGKEKPINGNELCMICYTENLSEAPCIKSKCGHIYHYQCVLKMMSFRWSSKWISFTFCRCPLCKDWLKFEGIPEELNQKVQDAHNLFEEVQKRSLERLKHEGKDKDPEIVDQNSYFFNKPEEYAMKLFAYYECFKCKKPYFGGLHNCEQEIRELENNGEEEKQEINRKEYICPNCSDHGKSICKCSKHGEDYIIWKCRFCCSIARWFCHGNTHYCEPCHNIWQEQQKKAKEGKLIQCTNETCKLKNDHFPHGEEFGMGCGACKNISDIA